MTKIAGAVILILSFGASSVHGAGQISVGVELTPLQDGRGTTPIAEDDSRAERTDELLMILVAFGAFGLYFHRQYQTISRSRQRIGIPAELSSSRLLGRRSRQQPVSPAQLERAGDSGLVDGPSTLKV